MFEMARDHARDNTDFEVVGGYLSLVNDAYKKPGLAPSIHRYNMCRLACDKTSDWLMVDPYEARQENYVPTAPVLDHFDEEINKIRKGVAVVDENGREIGRKNVRIILLAGSDLIQTMSEPGVWAEEDVSGPHTITIILPRMADKASVPFSLSERSFSSITYWENTDATSSKEQNLK